MYSYDMLSDQPNDAEIKEVLQSMGSPTKLAEQYRQNPRYLISPQVYDVGDLCPFLFRQLLNNRRDIALN
jgi:hypothetical protein